MNGPLLQYEDIGENNSHIEQIDEAHCSNLHRTTSKLEYKGDPVNFK